MSHRKGKTFPVTSQRNKREKINKRRRSDISDLILSPSSELKVVLEVVVLDHYRSKMDLSDSQAEGIFCTFQDIAESWQVN